MFQGTTFCYLFSKLRTFTLILKLLPWETKNNPDNMRENEPYNQNIFHF